MTSGKLAVAALAAVALTGAALGGLIVPLTQPAPKRPADKAPASDPAEPHLKVEVSAGGSGATVTGSARGTAVKFNTSGPWHGSANVTFKNSAPPMRFSLILAQMQSFNLESLALTSGCLSLAVGPVSASPTTKYFDAKGKALNGPDGASYTLTARRWDGEVDIEVRRSSGAALGKVLTVSWRSDPAYGRARPFPVGKR
jgi:hypothetical protein